MNSRVTFFLICVLTKWFMLLDKIITSLFGIILAHTSFWGTINHSKRCLMPTVVSGNRPIFEGFHWKRQIFEGIENSTFLFLRVFEHLYEPCPDHVDNRKSLLP